MSSPLLSYEEASALVLSRAEYFCGRTSRTERIDLASALGRVLAEPIASDHEQPPFDRSTRDGFACRAEEALDHEWLTLAGSTRAGQSPAGPLQSGAAWEIMTGAAVPSGADAVVMLEHVERDGDRIRLHPSRKLAKGENVVPMGAEAHAGDVLLHAGVRLDIAQIALAAACGHAQLEVFARPKVGILTTGDELVAVEQVPGPGQIRNSNAPMLAALVLKAGGVPLILPVARDTAESLDAALAQTREEADLLLISGGVSAGKFDLVEPALARLGAEFHFTGIRIQPGKPLVFGELPPDWDRRAGRVLPFFGLPGNPISSAATFLLFAAPVLAALTGCRTQVPRFALARLQRDVKGKEDLTRFVPSFCSFRMGGDMPEVAPVGSQGSGDLAAFARSTCFLVVPEKTKVLEAGSTVPILIY